MNDVSLIRIGRNGIRLRTYLLKQLIKLKTDLRQAYDYHAKLSLDTEIENELVSETKELEQRIKDIALIGRQAILLDPLLPHKNLHKQLELYYSDSEDDTVDTAEWSQHQIGETIESLVFQVRSSSQKQKRRKAIKLIATLLRRHKCARESLELLLSALIAKVSLMDIVSLGTDFYEGVAYNKSTKKATRVQKNSRDVGPSGAKNSRNFSNLWICKESMPNVTKEKCSCHIAIAVKVQISFICYQEGRRTTFGCTIETKTSSFSYYSSSFFRLQRIHSY